MTLRCPNTDASAADLPAQLDSAADRSVIPGKLVVDLGLVPYDRLPAVGFGGQVFLLPTYRVELGIRGLQPVLTEVFAHDEEPVVLLGRDILNRYNIALLGPTQKLEIDA